jgi:hypothetical protein
MLVKERSRLRVGGLGRGGLGFRAGNGVAWLFARGLRLPAAPLRAVDLCLDGPMATIMARALTWPAMTFGD